MLLLFADTHKTKNDLSARTSCASRRTDTTWKIQISSESFYFGNLLTLLKNCGCRDQCVCACVDGSWSPCCHAINWQLVEAVASKLEDDQQGKKIIEGCCLYVYNKNPTSHQRAFICKGFVFFLFPVFSLLFLSFMGQMYRLAGLACLHFAA